MRKKMFIATGLVVVAIGGYMLTGNSKETASVPSETQNIKGIVQDYSSGKLSAQSASITSRELIVTESDDKSLTYKLPDNEFFLSIAPYVNKTHPCATHSLTGCQGEMTNQEFNVNVVDKDGKEIINQSMKSESNGFIDLWLPRDNTYQIKIEQNGKIAESTVSTFESDDTCLTTMQIL